MRLFRGLKAQIKSAVRDQDLPVCNMDMMSDKLHCKSGNNCMDSLTVWSQWMKQAIQSSVCFIARIFNVNLSGVNLHQQMVLLVFWSKAPPCGGAIVLGISEL